MPGLRLLVCGGRAYRDRANVDRCLGALHRERGLAAIIEGGARGADRWAQLWAVRYGALIGCELVTVPAEWLRFGKAAGPMRNQEMLDKCKPDLVLAFPGGRGTADMVRRARKAGVPVICPEQIK